MSHGSSSTPDDQCSPKSVNHISTRKVKPRTDDPDDDCESLGSLNGHANGHAASVAAMLCPDPHYDPPDDDPDDDAEDAGESDEFDGDGGPMDDDSIAEINSEKLPDPQAGRKLLAYILKTGKFPPACQGFHAEIMDMELFELYGLCEKAGEPIIIKKILKADHHNHSTWDKESLLDLRAEANLDDDPAELIDDINTAWVCQNAKTAGQNLQISADKADCDQIRQHCQGILDDLETHKSVAAADITMSSAELEALDCTLVYLIEDVLVAGQPMVFGALSKSLKTGVMIDGAISLGTGGKLLDKFQCMKTPSMVFSGESGAATLKATALAVAKHKGIKLADAGVRWSFQVPLISDAQQVRVLRAEMKKHGTKVLFIDPTYLALADDKMASQAGNVFNFGRMIKGISEVCQELGVTLVLLHHFARTTAFDPLDPCSLNRLAQAGFTEWARQWILIERVVKYQFDGIHELLAKTGGSAGHGNLYHLRIDEGVPKSKWEPTICLNSEYEAAQKQSAENKLEVEKHQKLLAQASSAQLILSGGPLTANELKKATGLNSENFALLLAHLKANHQLKTTKVKKGNNQVYKAFAWQCGPAAQEVPVVDDYDE
jgi:hypothetical protein